MKNTNNNNGANEQWALRKIISSLHLMHNKEKLSFMCIHCFDIWDDILEMSANCNIFYYVLGNKIRDRWCAEDVLSLFSLSWRMQTNITLGGDIYGHRSLKRNISQEWVSLHGHRKCMHMCILTYVTLRLCISLLWASLLWQWSPFNEFSNDVWCTLMHVHLMLGNALLSKLLFIYKGQRL